MKRLYTNGDGGAMARDIHPGSPLLDRQEETGLRIALKTPMSSVHYFRNSSCPPACTFTCVISPSKSRPC